MVPLMADVLQQGSTYLLPIYLSFENYIPAPGRRASFQQGKLRFCFDNHFVQKTEIFIENIYLEIFLL